MDVYFAIFLVIFIVIAVLLIIFAFKGNEVVEHYDVILNKSQPIQLTMPVPPQGMEFSPTLINPYPAHPPPMGFKGCLNPSSPWRTNENANVNNRRSPYPTNEEIRNMPLPTETGPDFSNNERNCSVLPPNEPPPPYSEAVCERRQSTRSRQNRFAGAPQSREI